MKILGIKIFSGKKSVALEKASSWLIAKDKQKRYIVTPNPEMVVMAQKDLEFQKVLNKADLSIADGIGLLWASQGKIEEKISGTDFMEELCQLAGQKGWRVFLLGGKGQTALKAAEILKNKYGVKDMLGFEGAIDIKYLLPKGEQIIRKVINDFQPDLLLVAYGAPWQEKWLANNLTKLKVKVAMVVGGAFDQIVHPSLRPPAIVERLGFGWFYRLIRQPWRIKRQLKLVKFVYLVLKTRSS